MVQVDLGEALAEARLKKKKQQLQDESQRARDKSVQTYNRPKRHRRKPGNIIVLAARNFAAEFKVLSF